MVLDERPDHPQHPGYPVGLEVHPGDEFTVEQERPDVVAEPPLCGRGVNLDAVLEPEHPRHPRAEEDQRVERAEQGAPPVRARHRLTGSQIRRRGPTRHLDLFQVAGPDQLGDGRPDLGRTQPEIVPDVGLGGHAQGGGRPQRQFAQRVLVIDLPAQHVSRQHPFGEVVVPGEARSMRRGEHSGGEQRLGDLFGVAAVPPGALAATGPGLHVVLDLTGGAGSSFGDSGDDGIDQRGVAPDDLDSPTAVDVFAHPPAHQRPVLYGHQRGLVRPVLDQQPG